MDSGVPQRGCTRISADAKDGYPECGFITNEAARQPREIWIKQEATKPGEKTSIMAFWLLNHSLERLENFPRIWISVSTWPAALEIRMHLSRPPNRQMKRQQSATGSS